MLNFLFHKRNRIILLIAFLSLPIIACSPRKNVSVDFLLAQGSGERYPLLPDAQVKNIILFIGDGMGIAEVMTARLSKYGTTGRLTIEKMPVTGLVYTRSAHELITDSANGATALATGFKTYDGMIATHEGNKLETILEVAKRNGLRTGLVVTSEISHATPASFASHVKSRRDQDSIAVQLVAQKVNVLLGGGKKYFLPVTAEGSGRKDSLKLIDQARAVGYQVVETAEQLQSIQSGNVLGLFAMGGMTTTAPEPSLRSMTEKAIQLLSRNNDKGFFLMVEGSQIDWGGHANDLDYNIRQTLLFDEAVHAGVQFARDDKHTLIVVTADHETGGMTINGGTLSGKKLDIRWTTTHHTGVPVGIFAYGPYSLNFVGYHDNTDIPKIFAKLLGFQNFARSSNGR